MVHQYRHERREKFLLLEPFGTDSKTSLAVPFILLDTLVSSEASRYFYRRFSGAVTMVRLHLNTTGSHRSAVLLSIANESNSEKMIIKAVYRCVRPT